MWFCSEIKSLKTFGYGEYIFHIAGNFKSFDPNFVLGLCTYLNDDNEIDIEFGQEVGKFYEKTKNNNNFQFVVQPVDLDTIYRFNIENQTDVICSFIWEENKIFFKCYTDSGEKIAEWIYKGTKIPGTSVEKIYVNFWLFQGKPFYPSYANGYEAEVILKKFEFNPLSTHKTEPSTDPSLMELKITYPDENTKVNRIETIKGIARNIKNDNYIIKISIHPYGGLWYEQDNKGIINNEGIWEVPGCVFGRGGTIDEGVKFMIEAELIEKKTGEIIKTFTIQGVTRK